MVNEQVGVSEFWFGALLRAWIRFETDVLVKMMAGVQVVAFVIGV